MVREGRVTLVLLIAFMSLAVNTVHGQPTFSLDTGYSQPAYLGQSMFVTVTVTNLASIEARVESASVTFDWGATFTGQTPAILQPGGNHQWRFDPVNIPSYTWTGKHSYDASVVVSFADSSGGWTNNPNTPSKISANFGVQEAPPPPTTTAGGPNCITTTFAGGTAEVCSNPTVAPMFTNFPLNPPMNNEPNIWGIVVFLIIMGVVILGIVIIVRSKPKKAIPPH